MDRDRADTQRMFVQLGSHEMRSPITVVRGYTELIRAEHDDEQTLEDTGIILEELDRLDRSAQRLVTLIGLDSQPSLTPVDLDDLLQHTLRRWAPAAPRAWRVESDVGFVMVDGQRVQTALDCLLENAVKFTTEGDAIVLRGYRESDQIVIEVSDEGVGIPPADLPHIFERFRTGPNSGEHAGTGLGLSIVRMIAAARAAAPSWYAAGSASAARSRSASPRSSPAPAMLAAATGAPQRALRPADSQAALTARYPARRG